MRLCQIVLALENAAFAMRIDPEFPVLRSRENLHAQVFVGQKAEIVNDAITRLLCNNSESATFFYLDCSLDKSSPQIELTHSTSVQGTLSPSATYSLHALAIGDWGVDVHLGTCCNIYRKTIAGTEGQYEDEQAQPSVAHLLSLSAARLAPKVIIGHGDNFYWNGVGSRDVKYRFENTFESQYMQQSLQNIEWINVMGNHDYGGAAFICGPQDNQFVECSTTEELLKQLDEKFTRQRDYKSPFGDRWKMPARYYKKSVTDEVSGVSVDIYNVDTNAASNHGGPQICCQCYGYLQLYGGSVKCNNVGRGHQYCLGGNYAAYDACIERINSWTAESLKQLAMDAKQSKATWKIVNSHYSPHHHMSTPMMKDWFDVLSQSNIQLFMNGHTHAEGHDYAIFKTHFITNGAGGGIQSESMGDPPPTAPNVTNIWKAVDAPYGFFELSFSKTQMKVRFMTYDSGWKFARQPKDTLQSDAATGHCWIIPLDGSKGASCNKI